MVLPRCVGAKQAHTTTTAICPCPLLPSIPSTSPPPPPNTTNPPTPPKGYALQAIGLGSTTAARSGFLLYLNVKLVPLFAWALLGRKPTLDVWASALVAFLGTALLAFGDGGLHPPTAGDGWSLLAAAASAMFILRLEGAAQQYAATNARGLNAVTLWVAAGLCLGWAGVELAATSPSLPAAGAAVAEVVQQDWPQIVYLAVVTTALCNWVQTLGQREVPAEKAALIYALDPVYGAAFARLLLGEAEALGPVGYVGGALVTAAALFSTFFSAVGKGKGGGEGVGGGRPWRWRWWRRRRWRRGRMGWG